MATGMGQACEVRVPKTVEFTEAMDMLYAVAGRLEWLAARISGQKEPDPGNSAKSGTMAVVEIVGSGQALKSIASRINDTISQIEGMLY